MARDRLSKLIWSILDDAPDTFVIGAKYQIDLRDLILIKAYIERLEIQAGLERKKTIYEEMADLVDDESGGEG